MIWRGYSQGQFEDKTPDAIWGTETSRIRRRAEVIFMVKQQKVIVDTWEKTITETLIRMLKPDRAKWTDPDDNAIMPIYDVTQMK